MTESDVRAALRQVIDSELGVNIVDLGLVYAIIPDVIDGASEPGVCTVMSKPFDMHDLNDGLARA